MAQHRCVTLVPLFNHLAEAEQEKINQLVTHQKFAKGEQIITPEQDPRLVIVARGQLKLYQLSADGKEQLLRVAEPGDYEGENALFGARNANLFGEALQPTEVCLLQHRDFQQLLLAYPQLSLKLLAINAEKMAGLEAQQRFFRMEKIEERLATYLLDLAKAAESDHVTLPMKMKELATFLGTTPETLSRKFKLLETAGWITRHGKQVILVDKTELEEI